eukprot:COSAG04_NODE_9907_length_822_cov_0.658368_2_plen_121_part_00
MTLQSRSEFGAAVPRLLRLRSELCCPASPRRAMAIGAETKMKVVPTRQGHMVSGPTRTGHGSGSAAKFMENDAPTPTHAEKSRTIIQRVGKGVLCTTHQELDYPCECSNGLPQPLANAVV